MRSVITLVTHTFIESQQKQSLRKKTVFHKKNSLSKKKILFAYSLCIVIADLCV